MKYKKTLKVGLGLTAVFALAAWMEWDGYGLLDRKDGSNILCSADPSCRTLTAGEVKMARSIFGDRLDYNRVKIFNRKYMYVLGENKCTLTPNGNIYMADNTGPGEVKDFSVAPLNLRQHFMHENTHVWQWQNGTDVRWDAVSNFFSNEMDYKSIYKYDVNEDVAFAALNLEQQAKMVENYYAVKSTLHELLERKAPAREIEGACLTFRPLERKIAPVFGLPVEPACQAIDVPKLHPRKRAAQPKPPAPLDLGALSNNLSFCGK